LWRSELRIDGQRYGRDSGVGRGLGVTLGVAVGVAGSTAVFFLPESSSFSSSVIFLATRPSSLHVVNVMNCLSRIAEILEISFSIFSGH
jgi:hypothetical protein